MAFTQNILSIYSLINECLQRHIPFAAYRQPGQKNVELVIQASTRLDILGENDKLIEKKGFAFFPFASSALPAVLIRPDFFLSEKNISEEAIVRILTGVSFSENGYKKPEPHQASRKEFCEGAEMLVQEIKKGTARKVVLSRVHLQQAEEGFSVVEYFRRLVKIYPNACAYLAYIPHTGLWMGATPELLLQTQQHELNTVSLAGTKKIEANNDFQWGSKELDEQKIVSDHIRACMEKYFSEIEVKGPETVIAGPVEHLKTSFKVSADNKQIAEVFDRLLKELQPTPAIAGFPKAAALDLIAKAEKHDRAYYSGFLGPVNLNGKTSLFVNLRCLEVLDKHLALYLGAGITADSDPDAEWEETRLKARTLLNIL